MDDGTVGSYTQGGDMSWYYCKKSLLLFLFSLYLPFTCAKVLLQPDHEVICTQVLMWLETNSGAGWGNSVHIYKVSPFRHGKQVDGKSDQEHQQGRQDGIF